jgi:hypothetical protein
MLKYVCSPTILAEYFTNISPPPWSFIALFSKKSSHQTFYAFLVSFVLAVCLDDRYIAYAEELWKVKYNLMG